MHVAVQLEFKADRKEPLGDLIRRVADAFDRAGLQPEILATFSDSPGGIQKTSAVGRALKKHPHLARFERDDPPLQGVGIPSIRRLTNGDAQNPFPMTDLLALTDGVPRSLPFHAVSVHFGHADFGQVQAFPRGLTPAAGIDIGDSWWVNGRNRALSAFYSVEADATAKKLPDPPATIGAVLAALGKPRRSAQFVAPGAAAPRLEMAGASNTPATPPGIADISPVVLKYRTGMRALVERIGLPHDLPSAIDELERTFVPEIEAAAGPAPDWFEPGR